MQLDSNKDLAADSGGHLGSIHSGKYLGQVAVTVSF
jgi:hypothetical protein